MTMPCRLLFAVVVLVALTAALPREQKKLIDEARKLEEDEPIFGAFQIDENYFGDGSDEKPAAEDTFDTVQGYARMEHNEHNIATAVESGTNQESLFSRTVRTSPELPVNLLMTCMASLAGASWTSELDPGMLDFTSQTLQQLLSGEFVDNAEAGTLYELESWAFDQLENHPLTQEMVIEHLERKSLTASTLYWGSAMCSACNAAFQQCQSLGDNEMLMSKEGILQSEWIPLLKRAVTLGFLSLDTQLGNYELRQANGGAKSKMESDYLHVFEDGIECPLGLTRTQCNTRAIAVIRHKLLLLKMIAYGDHICMKPIDNEHMRDLIADDPSTHSPFFTEHFNQAVDIVKEIENPVPASELSLLSRLSHNSRIEPDHSNIGPGLRNKMYQSMFIVAHTFVLQRVCPVQSYRWAVHFSQELDTDGSGRAVDVKQIATIRMVFNPMSQILPWEVQRASGATSWSPLRVDDLFKHSSFSDDPLSTAITGIEIWSASQTDFSNAMMSWLKVIVTRKGALPRRFGEVLSMLRSLGSTHNIIALQVNEGTKELPELVEVVIENQENLALAMNTTDAAFSVPDAVSWINQLKGVQFSPAFATFTGSLSFGFSSITTGFFLWNAIWVDNKITERAYSTLQGGLVWADIYIHIALACATHGVWVPIVATASIYTAARSLFSYVREKDWFKNRFPELVRMDLEELVAREKLRRTEICFVGFYSAVFVAENMARDIQDMPDGSMLRQAALTFDSPMPAKLVDRSSNVMVLFHDLLFSLVDASKANPLHNIPAHIGSGETLHICGRRVEYTSKYVSPATAVWLNHLPSVDEEGYKSCRAAHVKRFGVLGKKKGQRTPCSPSEFVLAFYHAVLKKDNMLPLRARAVQAIDKIMAIIAAPSGELAATFRTTILGSFEPIRSFQSKMFQDQDLGIMHVWFTLHMFHILTFRSTDEHEVQIRTRSDSNTMSQNAIDTHADDPWLVPENQFCTLMDELGNQLIKSSSVATIPGGSCQSMLLDSCGQPVNVCGVIYDPMNEKNWRLHVTHRALNEGVRLGVNITMSEGGSTAQLVGLGLRHPMRAEFDSPKSGYDSPKDGFDWPKSGYDSPKSESDSPKSIYDSPRRGYDSPISEHDSRRGY